MARIPRSAAQGAVVPVTDIEGVTTWQRWTYGELISHIRQDLVPDATTDLTPGSLAQALGGSFCGAYAYRTAALTLAAGAWTALVLDTKAWDVTNNFSTSTGAFTVPTSGIYATNGFLAATPTNTTSSLLSGVSINGGLPSIRLDVGAPSNVTIGMGATFGSFFKLNAGDTIKPAYYSVTADVMNVGGAETFFTIVKLAQP